MALYDSIAGIYDPWSASVVEDIAFYVEEALGCDGPVVELAVGSGRIAVPIAQAGRSVIGVDLSEGMLAVAAPSPRSTASARSSTCGSATCASRPSTSACRSSSARSARCSTCPTRSEKLRALRAARELLEPGGRLVFDVFAPSSEDIAETHGIWLEREAGIFERADWDEASRTLTLSVRSGDSAASMELHWLSAIEWRRLIDEAGFDVAGLYGWFDRRPYRGDEDMIWACRRRD